METDPTRIVTLKPPARKSSRKRTQRDYANLNSGLESDPSRWIRILEDKVIKNGNFKRMNGSDVGLEWLDSDDSAMSEPILIENPEGLGMKMPPKDFTVNDVAALLGEDAPVEVIGTEKSNFAFHETHLCSRCCVSVYIPRMDARQVV